MMTQQLDAIEARAKEATAGPWHTEWSAESALNGVWCIDGRVCSAARGSRAEDSEFVAHAREDVPALVAEVRRLRAALERIATENQASPQPSASPHPMYSLGVVNAVRWAAGIAREALR